MRLECRIDDCEFSGDAKELLMRMDADTHDPWSQGVYDCPACGKVHYINSVKGVVRAESESEKILDGKLCEISFRDGNVDLIVQVMCGDSQ